MNIFFNKATEVASEVASEVATEAPKVEIDLSAYNMAATVPTSRLVFTIIGLVLLFAAIIAVVVLVTRKQKGNGFGILGGIATYLVFFYFTISIVITVLFSFTPLKKYVLKGDDGTTTITSTAVFVLVYTLVTALIPIAGRWMSNKAFGYRMTSFGQNLSFGLGIACTQAVFTMSTLFQMCASMVIINRSGLETLVSGIILKNENGQYMVTEGMTAKAYSTLDTAMDLINFKTSAILLLSIVAILILIYQVAITVPLYAAHQKKIPMGWYGMVYGTYILIQGAQYLAERKVINEFAQFGIVLVVVAATTYFCYKQYMKFYKSEERDIKKEKEEMRKKLQGTKKIPRFENLSNL